LIIIIKILLWSHYDTFLNINIIRIIIFQIADNLENVLHMYPDNGDEDPIGVGVDHHYEQQHYSQGIIDDNASYQHQYYSNQ